MRVDAEACALASRFENQKSRTQVRARLAEWFARTGAICRGGGRAILTRSWFRSSCSSRRRSRPSSHFTSGGSRASRISPRSRRRPKPRCSRSGRGSATTRGREISTRAAKQVVARTRRRAATRSRSHRALPGVGPLHRGRDRELRLRSPVAAIDANIARVLARLLDLHEPIDAKRGADILWKAAEGAAPENRRTRIHTSALMELGALVCTPAQAAMPALPRARAMPHHRPRTSPRSKKPRAKTVALREDCAWIVQRPPHSPRTADRPALARPVETARAARAIRALPPSRSPFSPTHSRIIACISPFSRRRRPRRLAGTQQWFLLAELADVALAAPHRRAIEGVLRRDRP